MRLIPPFLLSCSLLLVPAAGQEETIPAAAPASSDTTQPAKPTPDLSQAFGLLRSLGVPSVKDALPRKSEREYYGGDEGLEILASYLWEKKGADGGRILVLGQTLEMPASNKKAEEDSRANALQMQMMMMSSMGIGGASQHASEVLASLSSPMEVNRLRNGTPDLELAKKVTGIITKLKPEVFEHYYAERRTLSGLGRTLLFACQLDERGHQEEANRLAQTALSTPVGAEPVIATAVTLLAESAYAQALHRFLQSGDMRAWKTDLDGILAKFSRGYANAIAVKLALADATAALDPKPLAPPEADALAKEWRTQKMDELTTKRIKDALSIVSGDESSRGYYDNFWSGEGEKPAPAMPWLLDTSLAKSEDALGKILAKGLDALPILLALTKDGTATANSSALVTSQRNVYSYSYGSGRASTEEKAISHYQSTMPRPVTVGEIATVLLASSLTGLEEHAAAPRPEEIPDLVEAWLGTLHNRTPQAIADHYFESGNPAQKSAALRTFLAQPDPARLKKIEDFLLAARPRGENLQLLTEYLTARGSDGADFFARYRKVVDEEFENATNEYLRDEWSAYDNSVAKAKKQAQARLKPLEALVKGVDVDALLQDLSQSEDYRTIQQQVVLLKTGMGKLKPEEAIAKWLAALGKTNDPVARGRLLQMSSQFVPPGPMAATHREGWKTLLEDQRVAYAEEMLAHLEDGQKPPNVAQFAAYTWHTVHASEQQPDDERAMRMAQVLGDSEFYDFLVTRAKAAVAGSPVPPWPDEDKLGKPELDALLAKLNGLPPAEIPAAVKALGHKEKFALMAMEEPVAASAKAARIVHEVKLNEASEKPLAFTKDWLGKPLTAAMVQQLIEALRTDDGKVGYVVKLGTDTLIPGIQMEVHTNPPYSRSSGEYTKPAVSVQGSAAAPGDTENTSVEALYLSEEDAKKLEGEEKTAYEEGQQKLTGSLAKFLATEATDAISLQLNLERIVPGRGNRNGAFQSIFER